MFDIIAGWFNYVVYRLNNSLFFAGIIMLMLNIGSRYIELKLDPSTENFLKTALTKELLVFSVCWMGTRDLILALILTAVFVVLADYAMDVLERAKKQRETMKHNNYLTAFRSAKYS